MSCVSYDEVLCHRNCDVFIPTGHGSVEDMLDVENKRLADNLATKASRLKSVSNFLIKYHLSRYCSMT